MLKLIKDKKELIIVIAVTFIIASIFNLPWIIGLWMTTSFNLSSLVILLIGYLIVSVGFWIVVNREH